MRAHIWSAERDTDADGTSNVFRPNPLESLARTMQTSDVEEALLDLPPSSKFIYKTLSREGSMTLKQITEETLLCSRTARYGLTKLEDEGLIEEAPALHDGRQTCYSISHRSLGQDRTGYPEQVLVRPDSAYERLDEFKRDDPSFRLVEVSTEYDEGHIPGAVELDPRADFSDAGTRTIPDANRLETLLGERGITPDSTVVLYSDEFNEFAAFVYWTLKYYRHRDVRLLNGGKYYWTENGFPTTGSTQSVTHVEYDAQPPNEHVRAYRQDVQDALSEDVAIVDVRAHEEYCGDVDAPARASGHIPRTVNIEWESVVRECGRFEHPRALERPFAEADIDEDDDIIVYCNVGERSALVWFALSELLGYPNVTNYDGSWTEWGNLVDVPIETCDVEEE
ncbi:thiosulfate/3-mercaptopyruvate sulfurtransferase [Halorientalis persicus]|uniref:Sulfurtransferase n=2 Tax=Halorientalis persicus TaxID=1367881 RepID=A0A1H8VPR7_9EURY|nr:thiosulfate/3-mercaptopyruvate sulfurtransferase [Halorientalis persicus]